MPRQGNGRRGCDKALSRLHRTVQGLACKNSRPSRICLHTEWETLYIIAPLDNFVGKNVAGLETVIIPDYGTTEFDTCMSDIILKVKTAILGKGEAQAKANEQLAAIREQLASAMTDEDIVALMKATKELPKIMQSPFFSEMQKNLAAKGYTFDKDKNYL